MEWLVPLTFTGVIVGVFLVKRLLFVPADLARKHLAAGALVIDVRSPEEFRADPVKGAVNIPLTELNLELPQHVPNKDGVLLVHCLSGGRSAIAARQLKKLGYPNVFNLGGARRAKQIVACG